MSEKKVVFFPNLDGLRFFAFFSVFLAHSFYTTVPALKTHWIYEAVTFVTSKGIFGVNFFFVLSGFLITYLLLVEKDLKGTINVKYFYFRRFLRIWPLYYAVVLFGFVVLPIAYSYIGKDFGTPGNIWLFLFFLSNYDTTTTNAILGILWSIAVEEQFYLIWPVVFLLVPTKRHVWVFYLIILASLIYRISFAHDSHIIFKHTLSCISDMAVGGLGAYWAYKGIFVEKIKSMPRWGILSIYLIGFLMIVFRSSWNGISPLVYGGERLIFSILFLFVVFEQNYADNSLFKMQNWKLISKLGIYTYGLYMVHFISIYFFNVVFDKMGWNTNLFELMVFEPFLALIGTICIAIVSFYILENPFLKLKKRFSYIVKAKQ